MKQLKFKTNINCTGCLSKVKPVLETEKQIEKWEIDLESDDRLLRVDTEELVADDIKLKLARIGFNAEEVFA